MKRQLPIDEYTQERLKFFTKCLTVIMSADRRADSVPMHEWNEHFGKAEMLIGEPCEFVQNLLQPKDFRQLTKAAHIAHIQPEHMITFCNLFACEMSELGQRAEEYKEDPTLLNRLSLVNQNQLVTLLAASVLGHFEFSHKKGLDIGEFLDPIIQLHELSTKPDSPREYLLHAYDKAWEEHYNLKPDYSKRIKTEKRPLFTPAQIEDDVLDWIQDGAVEIFAKDQPVSPNCALLIMEKQGIDWKGYIQKLHKETKGEDVKVAYDYFPEEIKAVLNSLYQGKDIEKTRYRTKFPEAKKQSEITNPYEESNLVRGLECLSRVSDVSMVGKIASTYFDNKHHLW
jgi:hypothetical protein